MAFDRIIIGETREAMRAMPAGSVHCVVTSPPYWGLRDYGIPGVDWADGWHGVFGLEPTPEQFITHAVEIFRDVRRVLRDDGTLWLNLGDSYAQDTKWGGQTGGKHAKGLHGTTMIGRNRTTSGRKDGELCNLPHRVAEALSADGWFWRSTIIWAKRSPMPESISGWRWVRCRVKQDPLPREHKGHERLQNGRAENGRDFAKPKWTPCPGCKKCEPNGGLILRKGKGRPTNSHEYVFLFAKSLKYFIDQPAFSFACQNENLHTLPSYQDRIRVLQSAKPQKSTIVAVQGVHEGNQSSTAPLAGGEAEEADPGSRNTDHQGRCTLQGKCGSGMPSMQSKEGLADSDPILVPPNPRSVWTLSSEPFKGTVETVRQVRVEAGALCDDMTHKVSLSCPVHGSADHPGSSHPCDERAADLPIRTSCNGACLGPVPLHGSGTIPQQALPTTEGQTRDYSGQLCSPTATPRSKKKSKKALAPETNLPCTPFSEISFRNGDTSGSLASSEQHRDTSDCNTLVGDSRDSRSNQNVRGIEDTGILQESFASIESLLEAGCTCEFYRQITEKTSHFATFPTMLARKCIEAGTSAGGCCPTCEAPYAPVVESERVATRPGLANKIWKHADGDHIGQRSQDAPNLGPQRHIAITRITGYRQTCPCIPLTPIGCLVFDPFGGSGTTAQVAKALGRRWLMTEVNPEYAALAEKRIETPPKWKHQKPVKKRRKKCVRQGVLFAD